jgi:hypothetical protein
MWFSSLLCLFEFGIITEDEQRIGNSGKPDREWCSEISRSGASTCEGGYRSELLKQAMERRQQIPHPQHCRNLNETNSFRLPAEFKSRPCPSPPSNGMRMAASVNYKAMNEVY